MITDSSTLTQLQAYVARMELERNFHDQSAAVKCLLLGEEVGELFKAVRRTSGLSVDLQSDPKEVADELADILNYLMAIANRYEIDLGKAFVAKEQINRTRTWHPTAS